MNTGFLLFQFQTGATSKEAPAWNSTSRIVSVRFSLETLCMKKEDRKNWYSRSLCTKSYPWSSKSAVAKTKSNSGILSALHFNALPTRVRQQGCCNSRVTSQLSASDWRLTRPILIKTRNSKWISCDRVPYIRVRQHSHLATGDSDRLVVEGVVTLRDRSALPFPSSRLHQVLFTSGMSQYL